MRDLVYIPTVHTLDEIFQDDSRLEEVDDGFSLELNEKAKTVWARILESTDQLMHDAARTSIFLEGLSYTISPLNRLSHMSKKKQGELIVNMENRALRGPQWRLVNDLWREGATLHKTEEIELLTNASNNMREARGLLRQAYELGNNGVVQSLEFRQKLGESLAKKETSQSLRNQSVAVNINRNLRNGRLGLLIFGYSHIDGIFKVLEGDINTQILDPEIQRKIDTEFGQAHLSEQGYSRGVERF